MEEVPEGEEEREYDGAGTLQPFSDNDTTTLFQDLEHELEKMVQKYHVPPGDLENLFQVVQNMFEMMDASRDTYESLVEQKRELEGLWQTEKDKAKVAQKKKLELECKLDDERSKLESEKSNLERDKVSLQTKLKQAIEHKSYIEQELLRLKDKATKDDQTRRDLLDHYKKQYDIARRSSLKRAASMRSHRRLPIAPTSWEAGPPGFQARKRVQGTPDSLQSSEDSFLHSATSGSGSESTSLAVTHSSPPPSSSTITNTLPLEEEIEREREKERASQTEAKMATTPSTAGLGDSYEEQLLGHPPPISSDEEETDSEEEGPPVAPENGGGLSLAEELMAVDPDILAPAKTEMEMLQKEKEEWEKEKSRLEREREEARERKEKLESLHAQMQVELQQLKQKQAELQEEIQEVRKERDEVLETYLDQPYDDYCITRKELLELLRRHHNTTIELEKEKEEKQRLQNLLDAKKSFFEKFKLSMKRLFSRYPRPPTSSTSSSDRGRSFTPSDDQLLETSLSELSPPPGPPSPLTRMITQAASVVTNKGWLASKESSVSLDTLPTWIGQITLQGMDTERIECAAVGRVYSSEEMLQPQMTPPRSRSGRRLTSAYPGVQQLHAEVWVATTENSTSFIEIMDILSRTTKVRQRFVLKPQTAHVVCMKAIPGNVEESNDFTDSALISMDTSWVENTFSSLTMHRSFSDATSLQISRTHLLTPKMAAAWRRGSTSDLSSQAGEEREDIMALTQSLSIPRERLTSPGGAGLKGSTASALGEVHASGHGPSVARRLDFTPPRDVMRAGADRLSAKPVSITVRQTDEQQLPTHNNNVQSQDTIAEEKTSPQTEQESDLFGAGVDSPDSGPHKGVASGGERRRRRTSSIRKTVMWVITEDNRLVFYPTTDPSHIPINSVVLHSRALCIEFIKGKVYIGHAQSEITVYHPDEFMSDTWDTRNPMKVSLPSADPNEYHDVKCIAEVGNRLWIGAGPSIFLLDEQTLERQGSKFVDTWHHRPEQILPLGDLVLVATKGPALYIFDAKTATLQRKFDVTPITSILDPPKGLSAGTVVTPTSIKCLAADSKHVYVGTFNGRIVSIPIEKLPLSQPLPCPPPPPSPPPQMTPPSQPAKDDKEPEGKQKVVKQMQQKRKSKRTRGTQTADKQSQPPARSSESPFHGGSDEVDSEYDEVDGVFLDQSAVSLHCHKDEKVRMLLHVTLPRSRRNWLTGQQHHTGACFNSMPNLSSPLYKLPLGQPLFKSILVSIGKGHAEYSPNPPEPDPNVEDGSAKRERNNAFQLMLWGHRNSIP